MKTMKWAALAIAAGLAMQPTTSMARQFLNIGSGDATSVAYATAGAICRMVNRGRRVHHTACQVEATNGSVLNMANIRSGNLSLGLVTADVHFSAYHGLGRYASKGPYRQLRSVLSFYPTKFLILTLQNAQITTFDQLKGKRIDIGGPNSTTRFMTEAVMAQKAWDWRSFSKVNEMSPSRKAQALCNGQIDAAFFTIGEPSGAVKYALSCPGVSRAFVSFNGQAANALVTANPHYQKMTAGRGHGLADVGTMGTRMTLVASTSVPDDQVYTLVKAVLDNFNGFARLHPAYQGMTINDMVRSGLTAPLHPGAIRYFREKGWM